VFLFGFKVDEFGEAKGMMPRATAGGQVTTG